MKAHLPSPVPYGSQATFDDRLTFSETQGNKMVEKSACPTSRTATVAKIGKKALIRARRPGPPAFSRPWLHSTDNVGSSQSMIGHFVLSSGPHIDVSENSHGCLRIIPMKAHLPSPVPYGSQATFDNRLTFSETQGNKIAEKSACPTSRTATVAKIGKKALIRARRPGPPAFSWPWLHSTDNVGSSPSMIGHFV